MPYSIAFSVPTRNPRKQGLFTLCGLRATSGMQCTNRKIRPKSSKEACFTVDSLISFLQRDFSLLKPIKSSTSGGESERVEQRAGNR